jgi:RNA polymerase sigma factor (sigma-70 family)
MPGSERPEIKAFKKFVNGDDGDAAFEAALPELGRQIKKYLVYYGVRGENLEEIAQEAVVRVYINRDSLSGKGAAAVLAWIRTVCRNLKADHFRRGIRTTAGWVLTRPANDMGGKSPAGDRSVNVPPLESVPSLNDDPELREILELCINNLPERKRAMLELRYLLDLPTRDITGLFQRGLRLVQSELKSARESLADCLRHHGYNIEL